MTLGLNRRLNNIANTILAAKQIISSVPNLYSIELGNEPNCQYIMMLIQRPVADILQSLRQFRPSRRWQLVDPGQGLPITSLLAKAGFW